MTTRSVLLTFATCLLSSFSAAAQGWEDYDYENLQFRGMGLEAGWVAPRDISPEVSYGIRADLGYVGPHVRIAPAIRFWSSTLSESEVTRLSDQILEICRRQPGAVCPSSLDLGEVQRSDLELSVDAHYVLGDGAGISPYAGGGLGLHLLNGRGDFIDDTFVENLLDTLSPALNGVLGLDFQLVTRLDILIEGRGVVTSDVQYVNGVVGITWTLPSPPSGVDGR